MVYTATPPPVVEDLGDQGVAVTPQLKQQFIHVGSINYNLRGIVKNKTNA